MLVDAIRAESYRLSKNRTALFWSLLFVPVIGLLISTATFIVAKANEAKLAGRLPPELGLNTSPLDLGAGLVASAAQFANPAVLMFVLIGAATIFAGDYRWETWRLTTARNSRPNLLLGKVVVVVGLTIAATIAVLIGDIASNLVKAMVFKRALTFSLTGDQLADMAWLTLLGWGRIVQFVMLGLLAAVTTRSLLAALFVPLVVGVGQFFLPNLLASMGASPKGWLMPLLTPGMAADLLQAVIQGAPAAALPPQALAKGLLGLGLWTGVPLIGAILWFQRQDLSKE
ncbi:hypothetical protein [Brevundimonas sp. SORGH_AS_0993]|uniref:hypothetical protein n=1 Tax=Brevundimonas sp. SORGH_AS_0993 TaxID=3041794 RepID=UPI002782B474|nr:hypothetical protein [Brevundimonas sp. SORGH_AS_0993]MDQ1153877.1 ABC-2 type transport system permease protein [Brevundimonas sp. SORGH_AS_0993]